MSLETESPDTARFSDNEIVARTVWGEARGEGEPGWVAVAWVIKNRADHPSWWGRSVRDVCLKRQQFSAWNVGDPNREKMLGLSDDDPVLVSIRSVVEKVLAGDIPDPTQGSQYYATKTVHPSWSSSMEVMAEIGSQIFYKEGTA